jgi:hypothetical protein
MEPGTLMSGLTQLPVKGNNGKSHTHFK